MFRVAFALGEVCGITFWTLQGGIVPWGELCGWFRGVTMVVFCIGFPPRKDKLEATLKNRHGHLEQLHQLQKQSSETQEETTCWLDISNILHGTTSASV